MRTGISTVESLMVPKRLALNRGIDDPLAAFGTVCGMVFPVLMFPACILYALAELLIPELARCAAAGSENRIRYLVKRSLRVALLYGLLFSGMMYLLAEELCIALYNSPDAGKLLRLYACLVPMLYCDAITDAMTKGLGQQKICVRYNILTSATDVALLYLLLPEYGMKGYFFSFLLTHAINFILSLRLLLRITRLSLPLWVPVLSVSGAVTAIWIVGYLSHPTLQAMVYPTVLGCILYLLKIISREDITWLKGLTRKK